MPWTHEEAQVAVLSHHARQRLFAQEDGRGDGEGDGEGDDVVGRNLDLDGRAVTVVGVLPEGFALGLQRPDVYLPFVPDPSVPRGDHRLETYARLAPGVSLEQADQEARAVAAYLARTYPETNEGWSAELSPVEETLAGPDVRRGQWFLLGAVGLLLLLACVNVSSLFLAQLADRRQDLRMRRALGASGGRLLAQRRREALAEPLLGTGLMSAFSLLALLLSSVGVYGIVAYGVSRRRRELGVRLALGARPRGLSRRLAFRSLGLVAGGLAVGWAAAWVLFRTVEPVRANLYETSFFEPGVVLGVTGLLLLVGWAAAALPARRAAKVDPMVVLREE